MLCVCQVHAAVWRRWHKCHSFSFGTSPNALFVVSLFLIIYVNLLGFAASFSNSPSKSKQQYKTIGTFLDIKYNVKRKLIALFDKMCQWYYFHSRLPRIFSLTLISPYSFYDFLVTIIAGCFVFLFYHYFEL